MAHKVAQKNVEIKQLEDAPVTVEVLAESIVRIDENIRKMLRSGLTRRALLTLIHDAVPKQKRNKAYSVSRTEIDTVLTAISELRRLYTTK